MTKVNAIRAVCVPSACSECIQSGPLSRLTSVMGNLYLGTRLKVCCGAQMSSQTQNTILGMPLMTHTSIADGPWRWLINFEMEPSFDLKSDVRDLVYDSILHSILPILSLFIGYHYSLGRLFLHLSAPAQCQLHTYRSDSFHTPRSCICLISPRATTIHQTTMIKLILTPLMLAWILLESVVILLLTAVRDPFISLSPTVTLVSLPTEVLYAIVKELVCLSPETTQVSGSRSHVLALSR